MFTTRVAPSPTGDMHLGTARTALFNWLAARATGGQFILRIDDTDQTRNDADKIDVIIDTMKWLGLDYDGVYLQSNRFDRYRRVADDLLSSGNAVYDDGAIRLNDQLPRTWHDTIKGSVTPTGDDARTAGNTVLVRSDGAPTYHFASCVDDMDMGVNWVMRGIDHFDNTNRHAVIMNCISSKSIPQFTHLGLITKNKKKLSKRDGAASMLAYRDAGYDPDAMIDFMLRLGWADKSGKVPKVYTRDMALDLFMSGNLRAAPSNMDLQMLDVLDRRHKGRKHATTTS